MPKYLLEVTYTTEGIKGVRSKGGSERESAARELVESAGGTLECFYLAFGGTDVYTIVELPDNVSAAAVATTVAASGAANVRTVVLLTPGELDQAASKTLSYRPPGR